MNKEQGIQRATATGMEVDAATSARVVESVVLRGDISMLSPVEKASYYRQRCRALGLDPSSKPFTILKLNGKEILYADKGAADQLAKIHNVNRRITDGPKVIDLGGKKLVYVQCEASLPNGRKEMDVATVPLSDPENVLMKAVTKCKRRATLAILGLGMLDETEVEAIPVEVKGEVVDFDVNLGSGDDAPPVLGEDLPEVPSPLAQFYERLAAISLPSEGVDLWMKHRATLAAVESAEREAAWRALCERAGTVGKLTNAKVWMKKAVAERLARLSSSDAAETAGDPRAETPRNATDREGMLASLTDAPDLTELRRLTVESLRAYPAMADAIRASAHGAAKRLGCDAVTFDRMVDDALNPSDDPQPPAGGAGGSATGGKSSAHGKGASGAHGAPAARAANDVTELAVVSDAAQAILDRHGANLWGLRGALKKHRDELRPTDVPELARVLAKITPPDPATKAVLTQVGAEKIVCGLTGLKRAA